MGVCMTCMYACNVMQCNAMHSCMDVFIYVCMHGWMDGNVCMYLMYVYMHVMYVMYVYMYVMYVMYVCINVTYRCNVCMYFVYACMYVCIHVCIYVCMRERMYAC